MLSITPSDSSDNMECLVGKAGLSTCPSRTVEVNGEHRGDATTTEKRVENLLELKKSTNLQSSSTSQGPAPKNYMPGHIIRQTVITRSRHKATSTSLPPVSHGLTIATPAQQYQNLCPEGDAAPGAPRGWGERDQLPRNIRAPHG